MAQAQAQASVLARLLLSLAGGAAGSSLPRTAHRRSRGRARRAGRQREFEAGACTLRTSFAPDLVSVSRTAPGCGAELDGSYLRAPAES